MKKRLSSFLLAVMMMFTLAVPAFAQSITLGVDKDTVKAGEDVTVTVNFDEDLANVSGLALNLHFNSDLFTYKEGHEFDDYAVIVKGEEGTAPDQYKVINWASLKGVGTIKAGKYVTCTFTAKEDIADITNAEFVAKVDMKNTTMAPGYDDPTYPDSKISVSVKPAAAEPTTGYTVSTALASGSSNTVSKGENVQVALSVGNTDETVTTYNAYYMAVTYNPEVLTYRLVNTDATVKDSNGTLKIAGVGADKNCASDKIILTFTAKAAGTASVTLTDAYVSAKNTATATEDAQEAIIPAEGKSTAVIVGGYAVKLPDGFSGSGAVNHGEDYTFTALNQNAKYTFTATMDGMSVNVVDNGNGTYTVKHVTGALTITATPVEVTIALTNSSTTTISGIADGDKVTPGVDLTFTADADVLVIAGSTVITGVESGGIWTYTIPAALVTGETLTVRISDKTEGTITIIETGDAWGDVKSRTGWTASGDTITNVNDTFKLTFRAAGKAKDDYVVTINGKTQTMNGNALKGFTVSFTPSEVEVDGVITIDLSYKKAAQEITVDAGEYLSLDGRTMYLITAAATLKEGQVLGYEGSVMYWSAKYNEGNGAYAWLMISDKTLDEVKANAAAKVTAMSGVKSEIAYEGDVNCTGYADINDAQLVWNMYSAEYEGFNETVTVAKFLRADMNGDGKLSVLDSAAIIDLIMQ